MNELKRSDIAGFVKSLIAPRQSTTGNSVCLPKSWGRQLRIPGTTWQ